MAGLLTFSVSGMAQMRAATARIAALAAMEATASIGTNLVDPPYPYFLEFGTVNMPAYPAARPAFMVAQHEAEQAAAGVLRAQFAAGNYTPVALRSAARAGAMPIQNQWKRFARYRTGTYKKSIHTEVSMT